MKYTLITAPEADDLWGLAEGTIRQAIHRDQLPAQKSASTWLVDTADLVKKYGDPKPATDFPTTGETFFVRNGDVALTDIGRVPSKPGRHVLRAEDGSIVVIGGYYLRRPGEQWLDIEI